MSVEPWPLPADWRWARFEEGAYVAAALTDPAGFPDLPHIAPNHIEAETGRLLPFATVAEDGVTSAKHLFQPGDILYSKIRPYLAKVALAPTAGLCSADMYPIRTHSDLCAPFLRWWMLSREFTSRAAAEQARTVLPKINKRSLYELPVPIPPLEDQRRIVDLLEDHLSRLEAAGAYVSASDRRSAALTRSILESVVPMDRHDGWRMTTVGQAGRLQLGRARHPDWHNGPEMRPYLRVANVFEDRIVTDDVMTMDFSGLFEKYRLQPGDILLNEGQSPHLLGRPAIYRGDPAEVAFTNSLIRFQASTEVLPEWALLVFRRHMHSGRFRRESRITTNIAHLSMARLKSVEFPIPPLAEQGRRVDRAREALLGLAKMRENSAQARKRSSALRRALFEAAFSGRLTGRSADTVFPEELAECRASLG